MGGNMNKLLSKQKAERELEQNLQNKVTELPDEITPQRDLWAGIERAIQLKPQENRQEKLKDTSITKQPEKKAIVPIAWAASIVAAVLVTWVSFTPSFSSQPIQLSQQSDSPFNLAIAMQENFQQVKQTMLVSFGQPKLSELPKAIQAELTKLSSAQQTIEKALLNDPNNNDLLNLLRWTQKQELDLLNQLYSPKWQSI
jgi:hypothetical protein